MLSNQFCKSCINLAKLYSNWMLACLVFAENKTYTYIYKKKQERKDKLSGPIVLK